MIKHINSDQRKFDGQFLQWQIFILSTNDSKCVVLKRHSNGIRLIKKHIFQECVIENSI